MLARDAVWWRARKQPLVAFSTVEAEYIGASNAAKEAIWIRSLYAGVLYSQTLYKHADHCPHCLCSLSFHAFWGQAWAEGKGVLATCRHCADSGQELDCT